jgi:hypothetical protein
VATPEGRRKTFTWFRADLLPACQPTSKIRVLSTPMDPESVPMRLSKSVGWDWRIYPVVRPHPETGVEEATWPAQFPVEWVGRERQEYQSSGQAALWDREFMCEAVSVGEQVFRAEDIRVEPRVRVWEPVWAMIDPARTTGVLLQAAYGRTLILRDWIREGDPALGAVEIVREANMIARSQIEIVAHPQHFDEWRNLPERDETPFDSRDLNVPTDLSIRPARDDDYGPWLALWRGYCAALGSDVSEAITQGVWHRILAPDQPMGCLLACPGQGAPVGLANYVLHLHTWSLRTICYLEDLFVRPESRGTGAGRALVEG